MSLAEAWPDVVERRPPVVQELRTVFADLVRLHAQASRIRAEVGGTAPDDLDEKLDRLTESLRCAGEQLADHLGTFGSAARAASASGRRPSRPVVLHSAIRPSSGARAAGRGERGAAGGGQGWAALTPAELAVIRVVVCGCTNREAAALLFLSPHTVSSHLRHAYVKLGINSRVELVRVAMGDPRLRDQDVTPATSRPIRLVPGRR